jgi:hypothetical protein
MPLKEMRPMIVKHDDHTHEVYLSDDGTLDTLIEVDGVEVRYGEADRDISGVVRGSWLRDAAREACEDGLLEEDEATKGESA